MLELDGQPVSPEELSALALYNYGHYTTMRLEPGGVRGLSLHLDRLARDCEAVHGTDLDLDHVRALVGRAPGGSPVMVRVTVFDPTLDLTRPGVASGPRVLVTTRPAPIELPPPLRLGTARYEREQPQVKHCGVFGTLYQRRDAQRKGFDDVLFVDRHGRVSEGTTWNIAFLRGERVVWPASDCLEGVTMRLVSDVMRRKGIEFEVAAVAASELASMRSAFVTNAAIGMRPVASIDGLTLSVHAPVIGFLQEAFAALDAEPL